MTMRTPVTVLTGFLGAGKTTLVNRILTEQHGRRIAVIENEFGEVGVDQALVIGAEEEIYETSNGCICCTVRGDLIRILDQLRRRRERFDHVLIETTGLADPAPVAQTFFVDETLREHYVLDAIVTLVDARHVQQQLAREPVALEQIGFADTLLLNKIDLVDTATQARIEQQLRAINATARIERTQAAQVPLATVLDVGAFDLQRALQRDSAFLAPVRPFEWVGLYALPAGRYELHTGAAGEQQHAHEREPQHQHAHSTHASESSLHGIAVALLAAGSAEEAAIEPLLAPATALFAERDGATPLAAGAALEPARCMRLALAPPGQIRSVELHLAQAGHWALFCEHAPEEFGLWLQRAGTARAEAPAAQRRFGSPHHSAEISSVGLLEPRALEPDKVNEWLSYLLQSRGADILRMKGVLQFRGEPRRYVFHGVHMTFEGELERPWSADAPRVSRLVFIGRHLDRHELEAGLEGCVA